MSLVEISIKNYKSVSSCVFHLNGVTALLGENGTGKSNILSAVRYFYDNLISRSESDEIFDHNNRLNNRVEIALTYDLGRLKQYARVNLRNEETRYASYYEKILGISAEDTMTVRMIKIRDMPVRWSHDADTRKLIAGLFPLYFVDARQIDLVNGTLEAGGRSRKAGKYGGERASPGAGKRHWRGKRADEKPAGPDTGRAGAEEH